MPTELDKWLSAHEFSLYNFIMFSEETPTSRNCARLQHHHFMHTKTPPTSTVAILFLTVFLDLVSFGIIVPILPNLVRDLVGTSLWWGEFKLSDILLGVTASVFSIMTFLFAPLFGSWSDRIGRRPILLGCVALNIPAYLLFGFSGSSFLLLIVARLLSGIAASNISVAQAYIADITDPSSRARYMGLIGASFGLGFVIGPPVGGITIHNFGLQGVGYLVAGLGLVNLLLGFFLLPESKTDFTSHLTVKLTFREKLSKANQSAGVRKLQSINFLYWFAFSMMQITFALLARDLFGWREIEVGYLLGGVGMISIIYQGGLSGVLTKRFGEKKLLVVGTGCVAVAFLLLPFSSSVVMMCCLTALMSSGSALTIPSANALLSRFSDPREQGMMMGLAQSVASLSRITGPIVGTLLYSFSHWSPYTLGSILVLSCTTLGYQLMAIPITPHSNVISSDGK